MSAALARSTAPAGGRGPSPFAALVGYSLRTCLPPRRRLAMLLPCVAAVLFGLIVRASSGTTFGDVAADGLFPLVLPVTALIVGDAVLGAERRRGTLAFTWMSPVPTWQIAVARWVGGTLVAGVALAASFALSAVVAGTPAHAGEVALAGAFGAAAYVAVFLAIGCIAQRAAVWSLAFVFLFERLLGAALSGIAQISPSWEARAAFVGLAHASADLHRDGIPEGSSALVRLVLLTVVALGIAVWRLPRLKLAGSAD
jgi:ABC-type transport system involved in multi-copper enzyme maturation permease subunit